MVKLLVCAAMYFAPSGATVSHISTHGVTCNQAVGMSRVISNQALGYPLPGTIYTRHGSWLVHSAMRNSNLDSAHLLVTLRHGKQVVTFWMQD